MSAFRVVVVANGYVMGDARACESEAEARAYQAGVIRGSGLYAGDDCRAYVLPADEAEIRAEEKSALADEILATVPA